MYFNYATKILQQDIKGLFGCNHLTENLIHQHRPDYTFNICSVSPVVTWLQKTNKRMNIRSIAITAVSKLPKVHSNRSVFPSVNHRFVVLATISKWQGVNLCFTLNTEQQRGSFWCPASSLCGCVCGSTVISNSSTVKCSFICIRHCSSYSVNM